jgi:Peptidase family M28
MFGRAHRRLPILIGATALLAGLTAVPPAPVTLAGPPSFAEAVEAVYASGDPQAWEEELLSYGTNPDWGFVWGGTSAERETDAYIKGLLEAWGLENVREEAVPLDVFEFKHADVTVGSGAGARVMPASTFGGIVGTPPAGITAEVVYAGNGTRQDYDRLAAAGVSVAGKLVLVDSVLDYWWLNMPGSEATHRGAAGVVMTYGPNSGDWYQVAPDSLGSNDGEYDTGFVPMVYVARQDGDWLKAQLAGGAVEATMRLDVDTRLAAEPEYDAATGTFTWDDPTAGGHGYNVLGEIPGSDPEAGIILIGSHKDHHFRDAVDDTGANVNELAIIKAMVDSGYRPRQTIVFLFTTAEEYGYTNSWFDWSSGAWYAINHEHPEWAGRISAFLNLESMAGKGTPLGMATVPELVPFLESSAKSARSVLVNGYNVRSPESTWQDGWTFAAAGVPSIVFSAGVTLGGAYHTPYLTPSLIGWDNMAAISTFVGGRLVPALDSGLLPYSLQARGADLAKAVTPGKLTQAGADPAMVTRLAAAIETFRTAANRYEARRSAIDPTAATRIHGDLRAIEKAINRSLTALDAWESTIYPHQQVLYDTRQLKLGLDALRKAVPKADDALAALTEVGKTWNSLYFSEAVYLHDLTRLEQTPSNWRITWGAQGRLAPTFNLVPVMSQIRAGDYTAPQASLEEYWAQDVAELDARLGAMAEILETLAPQIDALH